jgi:hypothetical protein
VQSSIMLRVASGDRPQLRVAAALGRAREPAGSWSLLSPVRELEAVSCVDREGAVSMRSHETQDFGRSGENARQHAGP